MSKELKTRVVWVDWAHACILFALVFLAFAPAISFDFITYDDPEFIVDNPRVNSGLSWGNAKWALIPEGGVNLWNPLTYLSHQLDVALFGLDPAWHHAVNLFWHALGSALLFLICRRLIGSVTWSYFVTLLWAVHPQRVQSVAWISERKDVLSGALCFACVLCFAEWMKRKERGMVFYVGSLLFFIAAALAKPSVVPLPLVLWVLFLLKPDRSFSSVLASIRCLLPFMISAAVIALMVVFVYRTQGTLGEVGNDESLVERMRQVVMSFTFYFMRFSFPIPSRLLFSPPTSQTSFMVSLALMAVFIAMICWLGRRQPVILIGAAIYTLMWLPVSGIIPVSHYFVADRYSYLPQIGLILMLLGVVRVVLGECPGFRSMIAVFAVFPGGAFVLMERQLPIWRNSETLFGHEMAVNPAEGLAPVHYGEFFHESDPEKALEYFRRAHEKAPEEGMPLTKAGLMQLQLDQKDEALASFRKATRVSRPVPETWPHLLILQVDLKRLAEAEETVREGLRRFPDDWPMLMNGGNFYLLVKKEPKKALPLFLKAHELRPAEVDGLRALVRCHRVLGDESSAMRFERLLQGR